jgi:hypothetical protein
MSLFLKSNGVQVAELASRSGARDPAINSLEQFVALLEKTVIPQAVP